MKWNKSQLKKLENFIEEIGFSIRYEKGHFQAGYCLIEDHRVILLNKFFDTEARIRTLLEIMQELLKASFLTLEEKETLSNYLSMKTPNR